MADSNENEDKFDAIEVDDGSAVVEIDAKLLENDDPDEQNGFERAKEGGSVGDPADSDHPDDNDEVRAAKRNRRRAKKDLIRKTNQEKDVRLQHLQRENEQFKQRLSQLERNTKTEGLMRVDKALEDAQVELEYAKLKIAEATQNQDGPGMVQAQTDLQEANEKIRQLAYQRQRADQDLRQEPERAQGADPAVVRQAKQWMQKNPWYDPEASDADSRIAKRVDEIMGTQGWDPADPDYWDELDSRLQKEIPHRYNRNTDEDSRVRRPRNVVASSGREASAAFGGSNRSQFVLSPDRVRAMKEAGAWDNPERKARMIKQFIAYDKTNRNN